MSYSINLISDIARWQENAFRDRKLRIHPVPKENELLSSWIIRLAIFNELTPYSFMSVHLKEFYYLLRQDMDSTNKSDFFEKLSFKTGLPANFIKNLSLVSYDGIIFTTDKNTNKRPFLLYLNNRGGYNKSYGYRYCPLCLQESEYFRKEWRLVFSTACLKHNVLLLDRCPHCKKPLSPFIWKNYKTTHFHCPHCKYEYKNAVNYAKPVPEESKVIYYQQKLYKIIDDRKFEFDGKYYFSVLFFPVLNHLIKMILSWGKRDYELLKTEKELLKVYKLPKIQTQSLLSLNIRQHALLFTVAMDILSKKENLERLIKDNKISFYQLNMENNKTYMPYWYARFIDNYKTGRYVSIEEAISAIEYLKRNGIKPSMASLSRLLGVVLDGRKRKDIKKYINLYR